MHNKAGKPSPFHHKRAKQSKFKNKRAANCNHEVQSSRVERNRCRPNHKANKAIWDHSTPIEQRLPSLLGVHLSPLTDFRARPFRLKSISRVDICQHAICRICHGDVAGSSGRRAGTKIIWTNEWSLPLNSVKCRGLRWNVRLKSGENIDAAFWKLCRWCQFCCKLVCGIRWWILSVVCTYKRHIRLGSIIDLNIFIDFIGIGQYTKPLYNYNVSWKYNGLLGLSVNECNYRELVME